MSAIILSFAVVLWVSWDLHAGCVSSAYVWICLSLKKRVHTFGLVIYVIFKFTSCFFLFFY